MCMQNALYCYNRFSRALSPSTSGVCPTSLFGSKFNFVHMPFNQKLLLIIQNTLQNGRDVLLILKWLINVRKAYSREHENVKQSLVNYGLQRTYAWYSHIGIWIYNLRKTLGTYHVVSAFWQRSYCKQLKHIFQSWFQNLS